MRPLNQDVEQLNAEAPTMAPSIENAEDEANILADQDETMMQDLSANDENLGADGTTEIAPSNAEFDRGEIDVKEQMDRTRRAMDLSHRRSSDVTN